MSKSLREAFEQWKQGLLAKNQEGWPERKPAFKTSSDILVDPVYLPDEAPPAYQERIGFPGEYPYTRGIQATMYRGRIWTMRQYAGYASAQESNRRYRYLLDEGQTGLSVAFDLPTQIGYDADDPLSAGEVGKVGVSISSLDDMALLFEGIPLDQVSTSMTINAPAAILLAMYIAVAKRQGIDPHNLRGTIQNDVLKEYVARGTYIFPPKPAMRLITDIFGYCKEHVPNWNSISVSGYHMREAGATAVQELSFTLANAICYIESAIKAGLLVDEVAPQVTFFFAAHNDLLEEVAKFRAARRLWAGLMRDRFGAKNPRSELLRFHTQTAGSTLTAQQPENNVTRVALQALAAVLGGTQSLHTNSMDEALSLPTEHAVRIALRTQQILAEESGVANTVDPLAGSFYMESLTDEIERQVLGYLQRIESMGGALDAIQSGFMQQEISEAAYHNQQEIERGDQVVVGLNAYQSDQSLALKRLKVDPRIEREQRKRLENLRAKRDPNQVQILLDHLRQAAQGQENLMPLLIECVEADITLGEICGILREHWGEYQQAVTI